MSQAIFSADQLTKTFVLQKDAITRALARLTGKVAKPQIVRAVDNVSFELKPGETLGIVGESGCGKSTMARMIAGISSPTSGEMHFKHEAHSKVLEDPEKSLKIQMIFQDPMSSLNPRQKVLDIVGEGPVAHGVIKRAEMRDYVIEILKTVGLNEEHLSRFPHQFSGGQRQRVGIARALAVKPELLICDEAVAALDVSVQAQIANLLMDIREASGLSMIFISHDLSVIRHLCDRVIVMYLGRVVEVAETAKLFTSPLHPYTRMLLDGMPKITAQRRTFMPIKGEIPSPLNPPSGCHFHPRCAYTNTACKTDRPELFPHPSGGVHACSNIDNIGE